MDKYRRIVHRIFIVGFDMLHPLSIEIVASHGVLLRSVHPGSILHGVHICGAGSRAVEWNRCIERYLCRLVFTASFGGNQYDTISCTCTIDGSRRGIFQYGNTFHVLRVNQVRVHFHTVNQYQWWTSTHGSSTTDIETWTLPGPSAGGYI